MYVRAGIAAICILFASSVGSAETDPDTQLATERVQKERALLLQLERIEDEQGVFSREQIPHLLTLGKLYIEEDRCPDAINVLRRAVKLSRAAYGMFNSKQMEIEEPLRQCYVSLDRPDDFAREQQYSLIVSQTNYADKDLRSLPGLERIAAWYEQAGWYLSARNLYIHAVDLADKAGGGEDPILVDPLRSIARTLRLEYLYGLEAAEIADHGARSFHTGVLVGARQLDRTGEESLKRAIKILRSRPDTTRAQLVDALLDLGDWYQTGFIRRDALAAYREAFTESAAPDYSGEPLFTQPKAVLYSPSDLGFEVHRQPPDPHKYRHFWARFEFTVTRDGSVDRVRLLDSDAPSSYRSRLSERFKVMRFRPRFLDGQPVDTEHMQWKQGMFALR